MVLQNTGYFSSLSKVTLQGTVGIGIIPSGLESYDFVKFTDINGNSLTANIHNGLYTVTIPNNVLYSVSIGYTADSYPGLGPSYGTYQSSCTAGTFDAQGATGTYDQDFSCFST